MSCRPRLSVVFSRLFRLCSCPAWRRQSIVTERQKGSPSSTVANSRPISITSELSNLVERLVSVSLGRFMYSSVVLPNNHLAYRKGLGTCDPLLCVSHTLQSALESGQEAIIVQIGFNAGCNRVLLEGYLLFILTQFLLNRSQHVMVYGFRSKLANVVTGVQQGSVLGPLVFLLYTSELFSIL